MSQPTNQPAGQPTNQPNRPTQPIKQRKNAFRIIRCKWPARCWGRKGPGTQLHTATTPQDNTRRLVVYKAGGRRLARTGCSRDSGSLRSMGQSLNISPGSNQRGATTAGTLNTPLPSPPGSVRMLPNRPTTASTRPGVLSKRPKLPHALAKGRQSPISSGATPINTVVRRACPQKSSSERDNMRLQGNSNKHRETPTHLVVKAADTAPAARELIDACVRARGHDASIHRRAVAPPQNDPPKPHAPPLPGPARQS